VPLFYNIVATLLDRTGHLRNGKLRAANQREPCTSHWFATFGDSRKLLLCDIFYKQRNYLKKDRITQSYATTSKTICWWSPKTCHTILFSTIFFNCFIRSTPFCFSPSGGQGICFLYLWEFYIITILLVEQRESTSREREQMFPRSTTPTAFSKILKDFLLGEISRFIWKNGVLFSHVSLFLTNFSLKYRLYYLACLLLCDMLKCLNFHFWNKNVIIASHQNCPHFLNDAPPKT